MSNITTKRAIIYITLLVLFGVSTQTEPVGHQIWRFGNWSGGMIPLCSSPGAPMECFLLGWLLIEVVYPVLFPIIGVIAVHVLWERIGNPASAGN